MPISAFAAVQRQSCSAPVIEPVTLEDPRGEEVLVRIKGVGVCHTDMVMRDGLLPVPLPVVLGHEGAGIVESVGDAVHSLKPGDHVVLSFASCGSCGSCADHAPAYCHSWVPLNFFGARADGSCGMSISVTPSGWIPIFRSNFWGHWAAAFRPVRARF